MAALEQSPELVGPDGAGEAEPLRRAPRPAARSGHRQLAGEIGQVIVGPVPPDPVDPEHGGLPCTRRTGGVNGRPATQARRSSTTGITLVVAFS